MSAIERLARKFSELREESLDNEAAVIIAIKEAVDHEFNKLERDLYYECTTKNQLPYWMKDFVAYGVPRTSKEK